MTVDAFGRVLSVQGPTVSPAVGATTISYDNWGRPWKMTHPDSSYTQVTYDPEGNVTQARDENGHISYWTYDDDGRVTSFQNAKPIAEIEYYTYDDHGFLKKVTNARGYDRNYVPNNRDEVYKLTHADGQKEYWTYYATGEVAAYTNGYGSPDQTMASYGYDNDGRPTGVTYSPSNTPNVTFSYGTVGTTERTVTMTDGTGATTWHYDGFGRLLELDQPGPYVITYGYTDYHDAAVSMTDPSGTTYYTYNNMGQLWKLKNPLNETTEWLYDAATRLTQRKLANGTSDNVGYDSRSRVSTIALKNSSQTLLRQHTYGYDLASNITSDNVAGVTTTYQYDEINQLTSESRPGYSCAYTYDKNGNRATRTLNSVVETYTSDAADKLTSISVGGQTTRSITYDYLGRRKTDSHDGAMSIYSWDQESRITSITRPGMQTHTFDYNGLDTRVSKTLAGNTTTTYKRNGASVTDPVMLETTGSVATNHTPGISEKRGTGASSYLHSGMKNADARTSGQTVDASRQYDAFGNLASSTGTWNGPYGYAGGFGYQEDVESGLKLLGHRYYDSTTGTFLSRDPSGHGRNHYSYCGNNPVNSFDADGFKKAVIVLLPCNSNYQTGLQNVLLGQMLEYLYAIGYKDEEIFYVMANQNAVIAHAKDADFLGFIGHGAGDQPGSDVKGFPVMDGEDLFDDTSIYLLYQARQGKPLDQVWVMCCYSNNQIDDWFLVANEVWTYGPLNGATRFFANKKKRKQGWKPEGGWPTVRPLKVPSRLRGGGGGGHG